MTTVDIAFAGLGQMGGVLAQRLRAAAHDMRVFDISGGVRSEFAARGFNVTNSLREAASGADVVFLCLPDAKAVQAAVLGEEGLLQAEQLPAICVDLTSSLPSVTVKIGHVLAESGVKLLDAPVSGGVPGAREGKLTVMAGGDQDLVEEVKPLLSSFASNVIWAGPLGSGHAVKALNNVLSAASMAATGRTSRCQHDYGDSTQVCGGGL